MAFCSVVLKPSFTTSFVFVILLSPILSVLARSSTERCLRLRFSPPPPPPAGSPPWFDYRNVACKDIFRAEAYYLRETGKLSFDYLEALCNIFGDNEEKVECYIRKYFPNYDVKRLMDGNSCQSIRLRPKPPSPSV